MKTGPGRHWVGFVNSENRFEWLTHNIMMDGFNAYPFWELVTEHIDICPLPVVDIYGEIEKIND